MVLSTVVAMVTCAVFLRLSCMLQLAFLLLTAGFYTFIIETQRYVQVLWDVSKRTLRAVSCLTLSSLLVCSEVSSQRLCQGGVCLVLMTMFVVAVLYNSRQVRPAGRACPQSLVFGGLLWVFSVGSWRPWRGWTFCGGFRPGRRWRT